MITPDPQKDRRSGKGVRVCAHESRPAAGADLTSSLTIRHTERRAAGPAAHAGTGGTPPSPLPDHDGQAASTVQSGESARSHTPAGQGRSPQDGAA